MEPLQDQSQLVGDEPVTYNLPAVSDPYGFSTTIAAKQTGKETLPPFVTLIGSSFTIHATSNDYAGSFTLTVTVSSGAAFSTYSFSILITPN